LKISSSMREGLRKLIRNLQKEFTWKHALLLLMDLFVIGGVGIWWSTPFQQVRFYHYLIFAALLRWKAFDRFIPVRLLYAVFAFLFIDLAIFSLLPLRCVSAAGFTVSLLTIPISAYITFRKNGLTARSAAYSFIPAAVIGIVFVWPANQVHDCRECEPVRSNPRIELLVDITKLDVKRSLPRYVIYRPDKHDMIISYRMPRYVSADRFDLKTRALTPLKSVTGEVIGMLYDEQRDRLYFASVHKFNHKRPKTLIVLDSGFRKEAEVDFPRGDDDDYTAYMMPHEGKIAVRAEGEGLYTFDPDSLKIAITDPTDLNSIKRCRLFAEAGFLMTAPTRFVVVGGGSPLLYMLTFAHGACSYDLRRREFTSAYRAPLSGAIDAALIPDRNEILISSIWRDDVWILGPCVRSVAYDPKKKIGYAAECFSGDLLAFNAVSGKIHERIYIGKNSRKIYAFEDMGIIVLSGCGVLRVRN